MEIARARVYLLFSASDTIVNVPCFLILYIFWTFAIHISSHLLDIYYFRRKGISICFVLRLRLACARVGCCPAEAADASVLSLYSYVLPSSSVLYYTQSTAVQQNGARVRCSFLLSLLCVTGHCRRLDFCLFLFSCSFDISQPLLSSSIYNRRPKR